MDETAPPRVLIQVGGTREGEGEVFTAPLSSFDEFMKWFDEAHKQLEIRKVLGAWINGRFYDLRPRSRFHRKRRSRSMKGK